MRSAMAMIELIFAIVIIAISVMTIPTMMSIANNASKGMAIDDEIMARLSGWTLDKFQARWDGNYAAFGSGPLVMNPNTGDLNCSRGGGTVWYRIGSDDNVSSMRCNMLANPSAIPLNGNGSLVSGIEQLNGGNAGNGETITITPANGTPYTITATYEVDYVESNVSNGADANSKIATWTLGGTTFDTANTGATSNLKRVVTRFNNPATDTDIVLTFFKSNKGN
ncbi:MAG: hypothetical protein NT103_05890 [Campylobacterales bacterium]|nr:hypothetical protein [Campylobacterales bacterium]